jgi:hypothetical protein
LRYGTFNWAPLTSGDFNEPTVIPTAQIPDNIVQYLRNANKQAKQTSQTNKPNKQETTVGMQKRGFSRYPFFVVQSPVFTKNRFKFLDQNNVRALDDAPLRSKRCFSPVSAD